MSTKHLKFRKYVGVLHSKPSPGCWVNKKGEMFLLVGFGVFLCTPPPIVPICFNEFYFWVNGARLILYQMSLAYTYGRFDLLPNHTARFVRMFSCSGKSVGQCPLTTSVVLVMSSPHFSQFFHITTPEEPCNVKAVSHSHAWKKIWTIS